MKKLLSFVAVAFMFVACGSYTPKAGDAPDVVAKNCLDGFVKGEIEQVAKCFQFESENEKQEFIKELTFKANVFEKDGGIKSIETNLLFVLENSAKVKTVATFKNGKSFSQNLDLIKVNNTWYFKK